MKPLIEQFSVNQTFPLSPPRLPDYPHKYGSEGGCADHSVFERMRKYQASGVEEPVQVRPCITIKPHLLFPGHKNTDGKVSGD